MSSSEYKDTLNLPKTSFAMKANLAQREPEMLKNWYENDLYTEIKKKSKGKDKYILHDGPPYANGKIHIGHALNKILKDIIVKYKTMRGFDSHYVPGWDCHGLPIEHALFKELKIRKEDIDQIKFRKKARDYAMKYVKVQKDDFIRLGIFGEWEAPYLTMNYEYQASIIESFSQLYFAGYIYKGEKPIHWCGECETALAEAELEYADKISDSIFVRMRVIPESSKDAGVAQTLKKYKDKEIYVLIWTTTPWTLPANVAVAFHPELEYVFYESKKDGAIYIFALDRIDAVLEALGIEEGTELERMRGRELEKIAYMHPFIERTSLAHLGRFVSNEDGCGCVHIAPGHGQEDYQLGLECGLEIISPVNAKGEFTDEFKPAEGKKVLEANEIVIDILREKGALLCHTKIEHSYPHCWRCKRALIFRSTKQWFLNIEHKNLRKRLMSIVEDEEKTNWIPHWGKNRILGMLESRPDWCLSRQRYWGVPIPVVYCVRCEKEYFSREMSENIIKKIKENGADIWFQLNVKDIMPAGISCENCGNNSFDKEHDIIDVWFDSGVSHQAVLAADPDLGYPCALYLEGSDQHRGWFQTSLITSVAMHSKPPFQHVVTHGFTVDGEGKKMSKSAGNVIAPQEIIKKYGADILRLWVSSCDISQDVRISDDIIKQMADAYRKIRNTIRFMLGNLSDFDYKKDAIDFKDLDSIDKWALGKCLHIVEEITKDYDSFRFHHIYRLIYNFCVVEMSSFYLDVLKDRLYTAKRNGFQRRSTQTAMFYIVRNLVKVLAPILVYTTEEVWKSYVIEKDSSSPHLSDWPGSYPEIIDEQAIIDWDSLREIRNMINPKIEALRAQEIIGSSLDAAVCIVCMDITKKPLLVKYASYLPMLLIVSEVTFGEPSEVNDEFVDVTSEKGECILKVEITRAKGQKCERCWNYSTKIGSNEKHQNICPKCIQAIE